MVVMLDVVVFLPLAQGMSKPADLASMQCQVKHLCVLVGRGAICKNVPAEGLMHIFRRKHPM